MKHKIKVVLLPTEDEIKGIYKGNKTDNLYYSVNPNTMFGYTAQHSYATVSQNVEPIKEGDWFYDKEFNSISQCAKGAKDFDKINWCKITATTDTKLTIETDIDDRVDVLYDNKIPQLQQSFLKEFVANPDGEWEVEYEEVNFRAMWNNAWKLKLNQDNTVNITSVDNSLKQQLIEHLESNHIEASENRVIVIMNFIKSITSVDKKVYSRKELIDILDEFNNGETKADPFRNGEEFDNWIKENL
jgi:hypothetical protein